MTDEQKTDAQGGHTAGADATTVGNYFVSNYPPFSFWRQGENDAVLERLDREPDAGASFGLYVHIPFCRKRCDFCYFRVYTGQEARPVRRYLDAVIAEMGMYAGKRMISGRTPRFVYFGGGTPSFLSIEQLTHLFEGLQREFSWEGAEEITFECEPGTLDEEKLGALRQLGVTRLSLGVENFDPDILELNNRAHRAKEIGMAYDAARAAGFPQINIDLIAGMVGETEENWRECIRKTVDMAPESVTIYQMEIPHNTTVSQRMKDGEYRVAPVADWPTKRRWVDQAFSSLEEHGYRVGSAYTAVKSADVSFLYRDGVWTGTDMLGLGVSSFSHLGGLHAQNSHALTAYDDIVEGGELPIHRSMTMTHDERLIREFILQLKLGTIEKQYFRDKFGVDVGERFKMGLEKHQQAGQLSVTEDQIILNRSGLLQVDLLLADFFLDEHRGVRYT